MEVRQEIGRRLLHIRAGRTLPEMATALGVAPRTYSYYESGERTPDAEALAPLAGEGWSINWLLTGKGAERIGSDLRVEEPRSSYGSASQDLSVGHLTIAIELADEALRGLWLPRSGYAELVALVYNALMQGLPYAAILDIARPAAKERAGQGASDDSEQGLDRSGPEGVGRSAAG